MPSQDITLAWDPSTDSTVTNYLLYAGRTSGVYNDPASPKSMGNVTSGTYTVTASGNWFFAISAVNPFGEGPKGTEIVYLVTLDEQAPLVTITTPTSDPVYASPSNSVILAGTASDNVGVVSVAWSNDRGGSGVAIGTTSWTTTTIALQIGNNIITVSALDAAGNVGTDSINVQIVSPDVRVASTPRGIYMLRYR